MIIRGDDKLEQPDYLIGAEGFEVTFGATRSTIAQIKRGQPSMEGINPPVECSNAIKLALEKKSTKKYSTQSNTTVIVFCIDTFVDWYTEILPIKNNPSIDYICDICQQRRNTLFGNLYEKYIATNTF